MFVFRILVLKGLFVNVKRKDKDAFRVSWIILEQSKAILKYVKKGIRDNLYVIKKLVKKYFSMADGEWVMNPDRLLPLFTIKKLGHPHTGLTVCISHRSLKHFVERRKTELLKNYSENKSLDNINFIIDHLPESIINFDSYIFQPYVKHFYTKKSPLVTGGTRILLEKLENRLEIISIHFRR